MNQLRYLRNWAANRRHWMAVALLGVFLSVFALTLSEAWHRILHVDACQPTHQCAVTMLQSGQVETPVVAISVAIAGPVAFVARPVQTQFVSSVDRSLPPSCGPPALLS